MCFCLSDICLIVISPFFFPLTWSVHIRLCYVVIYLQFSYFLGTSCRKAPTPTKQTLTDKKVLHGQFRIRTTAKDANSTQLSRTYSCLPTGFLPWLESGQSLFGVFSHVCWALRELRSKEPGCHKTGQMNWLLPHHWTGNPALSVALESGREQIRE